ncbi:hypothetical protein D6D01_02571 [Aureobasidium pullulans]|uniref:Uncharacterized protein n=1 Tax=Aureobasidium pullulans TaxID=5580 RepID=A0A4S9LSW1_AURPU|nr:hypothetical protein D6D01_02571 [Aureobasidium pullulans]
MPPLPPCSYNMSSSDMAFVTKKPDKVNDMEMMRRLITLEVELKLEKEQHALAKQCINYMALQLAGQHQRHLQDPVAEEHQTRGRRLERPHRIPEFRLRQEIEQQTESKSKQRAEPEDLLDCDDDDIQIQSMGPPTTLPSNTPPTPLSPNFDKGYRADCHEFLNQNRKEPKLVDDSDQAQPTLLTFENSGVDHATPDPDVDNDIQEKLAPDTPREEKSQKPLSLENLSDRYKNNEPTIDGINASKWAKVESEKRARVQEVPEDLMSFPEVDDHDAPIDERDFTAAELEEPEDKRTDEEIEAAKQKHAAELRRNQALVMYNPAPSEDTLRTILVNDIPAKMTTADVTSMVCGGIIVKIQDMHTTPITGSESMLITFLRAKDARNFLSYAKESSSPKFRLLKTPTYPLNDILADDIMYNGVSRCLAIFDLHRDITLANLCNALRQRPSRDDRIVSVCRDRHGVCHVEFRSVLAALDGYSQLRYNLSRRFSRVEYGRDPCDRPIPGMVEEKELKEADNEETSEDSEIRELEDQDEKDIEVKEVIEDASKHEQKSEDEIEIKDVVEHEHEHKIKQDSETTAGAEVSSDSGVERDADGWPVGELDY